MATGTNINFRVISSKLTIGGVDISDEVSEISWSDSHFSQARPPRPAATFRPGPRGLSVLEAPCDGKDAGRQMVLTLSPSTELSLSDVANAIGRNPELKVIKTEISKEHGQGHERKVFVHMGGLSVNEAAAAANVAISGLVREREKKHRESRQFMEVLRLGELGGGNSRQIRKRSRAAARSLGIAWATIQGRAS